MIIIIDPFTIKVQLVYCNTITSSFSLDSITEDK